MSSVSNFSSANVATDENTKTKRKKITTNESVNTDVDNFFEIDMTTDAETDAEAEAETVAAKNLSHQKEIIRKLEEEYVEMNSYRKRLATSIDKYAKLLVQIDFGILEDKKPSKFREDVYDRLEEHKNQMLVMVENKDIKISLKDTILKQILNKRAFLIEKDYNNAENLNEYWNLAFNKVILNSKRYVKDHDYKFKTPQMILRSYSNCPKCKNYISGATSCSLCDRKNEIAVDHTHSFDKKLLAVLYTQINSINNDGNANIEVLAGYEYSPNAWRNKLFTLFSNEKIQRYVSEVPKKNH
ncbi:unnamed protein product [[Candida] boidinii]|nr:unnamed protein product [[Candida] boidinii]